MNGLAILHTDQKLRAFADLAAAEAHRLVWYAMQAISVGVVGAKRIRLFLRLGR